MMIYVEAAEALGWYWSSAHDGYISESHRRHQGAPSWSDYLVAETAEQACFLDGIEGETDALSIVLGRRADCT